MSHQIQYVTLYVAPASDKCRASMDTFAHIKH